MTKMSKDLKVNFKPLSLIWLITLNSLLAYLAIRYYQIPETVVLIKDELSFTRTNFTVLILGIWLGLVAISYTIKKVTIKKSCYELLRKEALFLAIAFVTLMIISSELIYFQSVSQNNTLDQLRILCYAFAGYLLIWMMKFKYKLDKHI